MYGCNILTQQKKARGLTASFHFHFTANIKIQSEFKFSFPLTWHTETKPSSRIPNVNIY